MPGASVPDGPHPPPPALDRSRLAPRAHVQPGGAIRPPRPHLLVLLTLLFLPLACDDGTAPPPTPDRLEVVAGDAQSARVETRLAEALTVRVETADGRPVPGATVAWRVASGGGSLEAEATPTDAGGVAANRWTLGAEVGEQTAMASVAGVAAAEAVFTATGEPAPLAPDADMELSGTVRAADVRIPEGVTVRVTDDVRIEASGQVEIAGSFEGDCTAVEVRGGSDVTISGRLSNGCSSPPTDDDAPTPGVVVVGDGDFNFDGRIETSGDVFLSNDPELGPPSFDLVEAGETEDGGAGPDGVAGSAGSTTTDVHQERVCPYFGAIIATPVKAPDGHQGTNGDPGGRGEDGANRFLTCNGTLHLAGVYVMAGLAGHGGPGNDDGTEDVRATGGPGGTGGSIALVATAGVVLSGENVLLTGDGGNGGIATATSDENASGETAPDAIATGGDGGIPGWVAMSSSGERIEPVDRFENTGSLNIRFGDFGFGGAAFATAANGVDATADRPAQRGGTANAYGGDAGARESDDFRFMFLGGVPIDALDRVVFADDFEMRGGAGGDGGSALAMGANGGNGSAEFRDGAAGGNLIARGGSGSSAIIEARGIGGDGGRASLTVGANGGSGYDACQAAEDKTGGAGGPGGLLDGADGAGGSGSPAGEPGDVSLRDVGNGGLGGDGLPSDTGGEPGLEIDPKLHGTREHAGLILQPGPDGAACDLPPTVTITEPEAGAVIHHGSRTRFRAGIDDPNQDTFGDDAVRWTSDRDGEIGKGPSVTTDDLSPGPHEIEVEVTDEDGNTATAGARIRVNDRPHVSILSPGEGETFASGSAISFSGSATDREDGPLSGDAFDWVSSRDGPLGEGVSISRSDLSEGEHRISLIATDSDGGTGGAHIRIEIVPPDVNLPPEATILSPDDGTVFTVNNPVTFEGSATDPEDGEIVNETHLEWVSDLDGTIGRGTTVTTSGLSQGFHQIGFHVTDSDGLTDQELFEIYLNEPPSAEITSPTPGDLAIFQQGEEIPFDADLFDDQPAFSWVWEDDLDGVLATGAPPEPVGFTRNDLSVGDHTVTITVTDQHGQTGEHQTTFRVQAANQPPTITVDDPPPGTVFASDDDVTFRATASDPEDGTLSGGSILWSSSQDGSLGTGSSLTVGGLSQGDHTITATATDSEGQTASDQTGIHMNGIPFPLISSPSEGDTYQSGDPISFSGSATDPEDGTLTGGALVWTSSIDGQIGTGSSFTVSNLSEGSHQITLVATDSYGQSASNDVGITVVAPTGPKPIFYTQTDASSGVVRSVSPDDPGNTQPLAFFSGEVSNGMRIAYDPDPFAVVHRDITDVGPPIQYDIQGRMLTMEDDGSNQQQVTTTQAFYRRGSADPSGTRIVFESDLDDPQGDLARSVVNDVFVMNVDGSGLTKVVTEAANPSFTPAGRIVYSTDADDDDRWEVRIADADGANPSLLVADDDTESYGWEEPVVSPDGTKIAVTRIDMDTFQRSILVGDFDGASVTNLQVVAAPVDAFEPGSLNPTWSPDSQRIAFSSTRSGDQEIWVMNADGSSKVNLSQSPVTADFHPFWEAP